MKAKGRPSAAKSLLKALRRARSSGSPSLSALGRAIPRMVSATLAGRYTGLSRARLALLTAAAAYVVSPIDVLPEGLLGPLGLVDDAAVLSWLAGSLLAETEAFLEWERGGPAGPGGPRRSAGTDGRAGRGGGDDVVEGEVIT